MWNRFMHSDSARNSGNARSVPRSLNQIPLTKNIVKNVKEKSPMYIIGIDPGKTGAAAHIKDGVLLDVRPFKGEIDNCRLVGIPPYEPVTYFIERVTASPQMGVVSAFTFGRWAEAVECSALMSGFPVHLIRPQVWQNAIGVFSGGDKNRLYRYAKKIFPRQYEMKMFNQATADAVLIAFYGWRYMKTKEEEK